MSSEQRITKYLSKASYIKDRNQTNRSGESNLDETELQGEKTFSNKNEDNCY